MNLGTNFAPLRLCGRIFLLLALVGLLSVNVNSQKESSLDPRRKDLVALRWPDLTNLEESVREQITEQQNALTVIVKNPATPVNELSEAYGKLGQIYHAYSLASSARDCYLNANVLAPKEFRWIYLLADLDRQQGRVEDGIRRYRLARTLRPDYIAVSVTLGNMLLGLNRLDDARENFLAALEIEKTNPAAHYGLGQIALSERRYAEAIQHFNTTLAQVPGANRVYYSLAMAYRGLGDVEKVKAHLAQQGSVGVRVSDPLIDGLQDWIEGERVHLARGKLAFEARRYTEAAVEFRKAVAASPRNVTARINLGATLSQLGDPTGAVEQFEEAIRIDPGRVNAHYNLAVLFSGQNSHDKAITHFQSALAIEPNDLTVRYLLGRELTKAGRVDEALAEFARVVEADPNNENVLIEQVKLLQRKGRFKQGLELLEKGHARYPQKVRTVAMLANLLATSPALELRDGARALDLAQRVYEATRVAQHGALVPLALAELGRCREASEWQQRMIVLAEQQHNKALLPKLQTTLKLFEQSPCRPPTDASLNDQ
ncbi:MAG TPA: tetratricopeptide repeat protein [Pyrinomonadaceae bacterium]|nr:tetratricopeptide repeat protein [Pyrinomonadaceae bacterium]